MFDTKFKEYLKSLLLDRRVKLVHMLLEKHGMDSVTERQEFISGLKRF